MIRDGFVEAGHNLDFEAVPGGLLLQGQITCTGGVVIRVRKFVGYVLEGSDDPVVQTRMYSYNASIRGLGTLFRYDSPPSLPTYVRHGARKELE